MPFTTQAFDGPGERAMVRECRVCPSYVVRCAHLGGDPRVVLITDDEAWVREPCGHAHYPASAGGRWIVLFGEPRSRAELGVGLCDHPMFAWGNVHNDRAEADRAFERYEAVLLGRQEEDER